VLLPFSASTFDEIHAYSVLEHYGRQGDFEGFFRGFGELWRVLKPGGYLIAGTPAYYDHWAWGDPGHTRIINHCTITYLTRTPKETPWVDYSACIKGRYWVVADTYNDTTNGGFYFVLQKESNE
jgi:SAM-dependent methyltransferase